MKLFVYIFLLLTCAFSTPYTNNTPVITEKNELPWSMVLEAVNTFSIITKELSQALTQKFVAQKPILITKVINQEGTTYAVSAFVIDTETNIEKQEQLFTLECKNTQDQMITVQLTNPLLEKLGVKCVATSSKNVNTELLKTSLHIEASASKIQSLIDEFRINL